MTQVAIGGRWISPLFTAVTGWYERAGEELGIPNRFCIRPSVQPQRPQDVE